ncbi:MAG: hypothetical protein K2X62_16265, partial [Beijerinckiaceae bacterium]|nr:hypothetical protein [Beijerinckiaceae bacterium]
LDVKADERSNVGAYAIHLGSLAASSNYKLTYRGADLTVTQRALSVTADAKSRIYGDANPALTYSATGLVNGDSLTGALSTPADERSGVGVYAITRGSLASSANYAMSFTGADLEIARRALAVQAQAQSRVYGDANPPLTYVATGLVNGDTLTGELASDATISSSIGSYAITRGSLASQNYAIDFTGAQLSVTPRQLVISADNILKQLGVALTFTGREFSTSGLALSDRVDSVSLSSEGAAIGAASGPNLTAAHYAINISNPKGENLTNYAITLKPGILSVLPDLLGPPVWPSVFVVAPSLSAPSIEPTAARATSIRWEPSSKFDTLYGSGIRIDEIDGQVIISR